MAGAPTFILLQCLLKFSPLYELCKRGVSAIFFSLCSDHILLKFAQEWDELEPASHIAAA